jgi:hypothetical protein
VNILDLEESLHAETGDAPKPEDKRAPHDRRSFQVSNPQAIHLKALLTILCDRCIDRGELAKTVSANKDMMSKRMHYNSIPELISSIHSIDGPLLTNLHNSSPRWFSISS